MRIFYSEDSMRNSYSFNMAYTIGIILMYLDNSINILFYILIGKNLRHDFLSVLPLKMKSCFVSKLRQASDVNLSRNLSYT